MVTSEHDAPRLTWPALRRPTGGEKLVYLDQKHWIHLAQAETGHSAGVEYVEPLKAMREARAAGSVLFPLSETHYRETLKITDPTQRGAVAQVMEELSGFVALPARRLTALYELDAVLTPAAGLVSRLPATDLLGRGFRWAQYWPLVSRFEDAQGHDGTEVLRQQLGDGGLIALLASIDLLTERFMIAGPSDEVLPELRALGYDPLAIVRDAQERADNEAEFSRKFVSEAVRRSPVKLMDRVMLREFWYEALPVWKQLARLYGLAVFGPLERGDADANREILRAMPGAEVGTVLKARCHRDARRKWTSNDMFDFDALAVAVPYCDIVGADNDKIHALTATKVAARMNTALFSSVAELVRQL